jgi:hypothetical protein
MKGNNQKSIEYYQQHFESARNEKVNKDRRLIDKARVYLGMAKANMGIGKFKKYINSPKTTILKLLLNQPKISSLCSNGKPRRTNKIRELYCIFF